MSNIFSFDLDTAEKIVSVITGLICIAGLIFYRSRKSNAEQANGNQTLPPSASSAPVNVNIIGPMPPSGPNSIMPQLPLNVSDLKKKTKILFVDDDRGFKIVGVLKKMGWEYTKLVTDISSLEQSALTEANVVFVDIQGVGRTMQYTDEGLGLALAIKRRYPSKKVVIYSAEEAGARFHEALQEADYSLPKTAEPIRFEDTIVRVLTK
jgi:hypothetical protein